MFEKNLVSVIMSNYNTPEDFLRCSIESILNQTYDYLEFIIVDDCSTDNSVDVINSYNDSRIKFIKNSSNLGITKSLNIALNEAHGQFVARMDADDYALPDRILCQVNYLKNNPNTIVCGSWIEFFGDDSNNKKLLKKMLPCMEEMQICLLFDNSTNIVHPSAMFNHELMFKNNIFYNEKYKYAQDYRMWVDCCRVGECYIYPKVLLKYRIHSGAVSDSKKREQNFCRESIMLEQLSWLDLDKPDDFLLVHADLLSSRKPFDIKIKRWILTLINQNNKKRIFDKVLFKKKLMFKWSEIVYFSLYKEKGVNKLKALISLPLSCYPNLVKIKLNRLKEEEANE